VRPVLHLGIANTDFEISDDVIKLDHMYAHYSAILQFGDDKNLLTNIVPTAEDLAEPFQLFPDSAKTHSKYSVLRTLCMGGFVMVDVHLSIFARQSVKIAKLKDIISKPFVFDRLCNDIAVNGKARVMGSAIRFCVDYNRYDIKNVSITDKDLGFKVYAEGMACLAISSKKPDRLKLFDTIYKDAVEVRVNEEKFPAVLADYIYHPDVISMSETSEDTFVFSRGSEAGDNNILAILRQAIWKDYGESGNVGEINHPLTLIRHFAKINAWDWALIDDFSDITRFASKSKPGDKTTDRLIPNRNFADFLVFLDEHREATQIFYEYVEKFYKAFEVFTSKNPDKSNLDFLAYTALDIYKRDPFTFRKYVYSLSSTVSTALKKIVDKHLSDIEEASDATE